MLCEAARDIITGVGEMKGSIRTVAIAAAVVAPAAQAATIVQFDSEQGALRGFDGFDAAMGTLDRVTLRVELTKTRAWGVSAPAGIAAADLTWTIDGAWLFRSNNAALGNPLVALIGSGGSTVALERGSDPVYGFVAVTARGSATYQFDPAQFIGRRTTFDGFDLGYLPGSGDTTFTGVPVGGRVYQLNGSCAVVNGNPLSLPESYCGAANYTLTYDYTPPVPEPATWAMMLAGFAATGAALRRRRALVAA